MQAEISRPGEPKAPCRDFGPLFFALDILYPVGYWRSCLKFVEPLFSQTGWPDCGTNVPKQRLRCQPAGEGISELRVHHGTGYRVYFVHRGQTIIVLLCGGDKASQTKDTKTAKVLAANLED